VRTDFALARQFKRAFRYTHQFKGGLQTLMTLFSSRGLSTRSHWRHTPHSDSTEPWR